MLAVSRVVVVVEVLVAQGQGIGALRDEVVQGMLDRLRVAMVAEAGGEPAGDAGDLLDLAEQQGVADVTLCWHRVSFRLGRRWLRHKYLRLERHPMLIEL